MKKTLLLFAALMVGNALAQDANKEIINLDIDRIDAACFDSYDGTKGQWHLLMSKNNELIGNITVFTPGPHNIAGTYFELGPETYVFYNEENIEISEGSAEVKYVSKGKENPVYHISANLESDTQVFLVDLTTEVFAYDQLYYDYYKQGLFQYEQCLITLDDGNEVGEKIKVELVDGSCLDYIGLYRVIQINTASDDGLYTQFLLDAINQHVITGEYEMSKGYASMCWLADAGTGTYVANFKDGKAKVYVTSPDTLLIDGEFLAVGGDTYHLIVEDVKCPGAVYDPDGINNIISDPSFFVGKKLEGGKVTIERNGVKYQVNGTIVK